MYAQVPCPEGTAGIKMAWRDSPLYRPDILFQVAPKPITGCLELDGAPRPAGVQVLVTYSEGHYKLAPNQHPAH